MRKIEGHLSRVRFINMLQEEEYMLFGPPQDPKLQVENFCTNGLGVFDDILKAVAASRILARRTLGEDQSVTEGFLRLEVAESEDEIDDMAEDEDLVALVYIKEQNSYRFFGDSVEGRPTCYPLNGSDFFLNGMKTIDNFIIGKHIAWNNARQMGSLGTLARFYFRLAETTLK